MRLPWRRTAVATVIVAAMIGWAGPGVAAADSYWDSVTPQDSYWDSVTPQDSYWD